MKFPHVEFPMQNIIAAIVAIGFVAPILWMALDRLPPYEIMNGRINPPEPVKSGEFIVTWDIKRLRACQPEYSSVTTIIIDRQGFRHVATPIMASNLSDQQKIKRVVKLPENITGRAEFFSDVCYACNPIQTFWPVCMQTPKLEFMIADESGPPKE